MCGFPGKQTPGNFNDKILQLLKTGNVSLIFYLNEYTDIQKITNYLDFLPFDRTPARSGQQDILVNPPGELNTASQLILFDNPELGRQFWAKIPPLSVYTPNLHLKSGSKTILQGKYNNINVPFIVLHEDKRLRMVLFNGQGFWKWHFYFQNNPELIPGYSALIQNMLRWTTDKTKLKPVMLETQRHSGYLGETISLKGFLFDGQYNPIKDGSMVVEATWNDQKFEIEAKSDSSGSFNIQFIPPGEGHYTLVASGYREGIKIGEDQVAMEIIPLEKEFIKTTQNADFLKKLARLGNGKYFDAAEIDSLVPSLAINNKIVIDDRTIEIWYNPVLLTLIIILITAEWITRKRLGLV